MIRSLPIILCLLILQGCELQETKPPIEVEPISEQKSCRIEAANLDRLQKIEKLFLENPERRSRIMQNAIRDKDQTLLALLLSTPLSSKEQLQQAKRYYAKFVLYPDKACPGDRYFDLRDQLTSALLWMRAEQDNLLQENKTLQIKIDALTQIETDLSKDRENQE
ncbi:hypothetical protein WNY58_08530 [Neptuniibacter pectenicola]|jgi:hypothetical protein|uniref:Secreted protein n=1 Tax=Neptuniibacter pectenicola TaxID=1806669 RepID=A0ABU9TT58_9GAMM